MKHNILLYIYCKIAITPQYGCVIKKKRLFASFVILKILYFNLHVSKCL